jgi:ribosomal protein S18 acetylase RimI-like enzyme
VTILREATLTDRSGVLACLSDLYYAVESAGGIQAPLERQRERLTDAFDAVTHLKVPGTCLVVGRPVQAFTLWAVTDPDPHPHLGLCAEALATYVAPTLRGQGIASMLYREARARLLASGVHTLVALTEQTNTAGQALLKSQGFTPAQIVYTAPLSPDEE